MHLGHSSPSKLLFWSFPSITLPEETSQYPVESEITDQGKVAEANTESEENSKACKLSDGIWQDPRTASQLKPRARIAGMAPKAAAFSMGLWRT